MIDNKTRILAVLDILYQYSDDEHYINASEIIDILKSEYNLANCNRKTIYADIASLKEFGYEIDTNYQKPNNGYAIYGDPFSLAEIKIIDDMLMSFKPIDEKNTEKIINDLHHYISLKNQTFLKRISFDSKKKNTQVVYFLETILKAIRDEETLELTVRNHNKQTIIPYLLDYKNNNYYLYYEYTDQPTEKIYHLRLDRLQKVNATNVKHFKPMKFDRCRKVIAESFDAFTGSEIVEVKLKVKAEYIYEDINDIFENVIINNDTVTIKTSISDNLFGKLCSYGDKVKILGPDSFKKQYLEYLKKTIESID